MKTKPDPSKFVLFQPDPARRLGLALALLAGLSLLRAVPALAQGPGPAPAAVDTGPLLPAALLMLLPVGLILMISSAMPERRAPAVAVHLLVVWAVAALAYFAAGFAFQFGGIAQVAPAPGLAGLYWEWYPLDQSVDVSVARLWGVVALRGWALAGEAATPAGLLLFLHHLPLVGLAAIIPAGALLGRGRGGLALPAGLLAGLLIYPLAGNWLWGGGWLAHLGLSLGWGHGLVDFGGAGPVFLAGSGAALAGLLLFRPGREPADPAEPAGEVEVWPKAGQRLTVYDEPAGPAETVEEALPDTPMPSAYLPLLSLLGASFMLLGWLGLSAGQHAPTALNFSPAQAAVNGLLAGLAAALAGAGYSWFATRELQPLMTARCLLAGLVGIMAGAPFLPAGLALAAGLLIGLLLPVLVYLFDRGTGLADELGTLATCGVSSLAGLLLVALLADGRAGQGWNGVNPADPAGVAAGWPGQFQAQALGAAAILVWAFLLTFILGKAALLISHAWAATGLELARPLPAEAGSPVPQGEIDHSTHPG